MVVAVASTFRSLLSNFSCVSFGQFFMLACVCVRVFVNALQQHRVVNIFLFVESWRRQRVASSFRRFGEISSQNLYLWTFFGLSFYHYKHTHVNTSAPSERVEPAEWSECWWLRVQARFTNTPYNNTTRIENCKNASARCCRLECSGMRGDQVNLEWNGGGGHKRLAAGSSWWVQGLRAFSWLASTAVFFFPFAFVVSVAILR